MQKLVKFLSWLVEITKEPLKNLIYNEAFIVLAAKLPVVPKWCLKAVLRWSLDKTLNPVINAAYNEMGFKLEVLNNEIKVRRIENANTNSDWNDAIDDLMRPGKN